MAHTLYTSRLALGHDVYPKDHVVPDGVRWVIRYVTGFNASGVLDENFSLVLVDDLITILQWTLAAESWQDFDMRVILEAGETLRLNGDSDIDITVNGWVLGLP